MSTAMMVQPGLTTTVSGFAYNDETKQQPCDRGLCHIIPPHLYEKLANDSGTSEGAQGANSTAAQTEKMLAKRIKHSAEARQAPAMLDASGKETITSSGVDVRIYNAFHTHGRGRITIWSRLDIEEQSNNPDVRKLNSVLETVITLAEQVFNWHSFDNRGSPVDASINFGTNFNNAFWNGKYLAFGNGDEKVFGNFIEETVIAHEYAHAITQYRGHGLEYQGESGALNESYSDVFAIAAKHFMIDHGLLPGKVRDWKIAPGLILNPTPSNGKVYALRDMLVPGEGFKDHPALGDDTQVGHYSQLRRTNWDNGGVHDNSGIPNRAFALVTETLQEKAWGAPAKIWFTAQPLLSANATMQEAANKTTQVAIELYGLSSKQHQAVQKAWTQVGRAPVVA